MAAQRDTGIHECQCEECKRSPVGETAKLHGSINRVMGSSDERRRRHFVGLLASQYGYGGIQQLACVTGMSRTTILRGQREWEAKSVVANGRIRAPGAGGKWSEKNNPAS
jgi:hypothetical protein